MGLIFDTNYNVAAFFTPSLGLSYGGGAFGGVLAGSFPGANSLSDVTGWGYDVGAIWGLFIMLMGQWFRK
ncbi:hypothetical protein QUH73_20585 [Labilibaculum sp. K2S]|uniref:hypothetical protein n=1 Tax=Labilibaculum sp. K2S TaxID=3056386 RepID=UPI0025A4A72D|nr:hypothetical protein [Labilibaculum sp. K2S]MDM8162223.1 hypothetical protein [Labilibaculum sp. K2S]